MTRAYDNAVDARYPSGRRNLIINGGFQVWQRGTSFSGDEYTADRWYAGLSGATATISQQSFTVGQTDVPGEPEYYLRFNVTGANDNVKIQQPIEDVRTAAGQTVTLSFWIKSTSAPTSLTPRFQQNFGSGGSTAVNTDGTTITGITSSWQKIERQVTIPSISGKTIGSASYFLLQLFNPNNETFDFDIANVQVELGNVATPFEHRSYGEELALCQRYYYNSHLDGDFSDYSGQIMVFAAGTSTFGATCTVATGREYPTTMRATPVVTLYHQDGTADAVYRVDTGGKITGVTAFAPTAKGFLYAYKANGFNTGYGYYYGYTADAELQMNITSAQYYTFIVPDGTVIENAIIRATIDGVTMSVPLDPANRHYAEILRQVEAGTLTIEEADDGSE